MKPEKKCEEKAALTDNTVVVGVKDESEKAALATPHTTVAAESAAAK